MHVSFCLVQCVVFLLNVTIRALKKEVLSKSIKKALKIPTFLIDKRDNCFFPLQHFYRYSFLCHTFICYKQQALLKCILFILVFVSCGHTSAGDPVQYIFKSRFSAEFHVAKYAISVASIVSGCGANYRRGQIENKKGKLGKLWHGWEIFDEPRTGSGARCIHFGKHVLFYGKSA